MTMTKADAQVLHRCSLKVTGLTWPENWRLQLTWCDCSRAERSPPLWCRRTSTEFSPCLQLSTNTVHEQCSAKQTLKTCTHFSSG